MFVTPSHILEHLHAVRHGDVLVVSNSLAFLLARTDDGLDPRYKDYHYDAFQHCRGHWRDQPTFRTQSGRHVSLWYHGNVRVAADFRVAVERKPLPPVFRDYGHYVGFLRRVVADVCANGRDGRREVPFTPLTTISAGYDSPACAVLAREAGCTDAVTISTARPGFAEEDDSGAGIAGVLGLGVSSFDRLGYLALPDFPEAEFLASGSGGEEVVFAPLAGVLERRILFTGYMGDTVWGRTPVRINEELYMVFPGGTSLGEFRLRSGFAHFPVPCIGYTRHPSIVAISRSAEMQPWTLGNDYDRPIARRLVEEQGVPRASFGRSKMAVTQPLWQAADPKEILTPASYADLVRFAEPIPRFNGFLDRLRFGVMRRVFDWSRYVDWRVYGALKRFGFQPTSPPWVPERYSLDRGLNAVTFHWGVERTIPRYRV